MLLLVLDALRDAGDHGDRDYASTEENAEWECHGEAVHGVLVWHKIRSAWRRVVRKQLVPVETTSGENTRRH